MGKGGVVEEKKRPKKKGSLGSRGERKLFSSAKDKGKEPRIVIWSSWNAGKKLDAACNFASRLLERKNPYRKKPNPKTKIYEEEQQERDGMERKRKGEEARWGGGEVSYI